MISSGSMKNRIVTNSYRTINKNRARFCSLMMMSFLGTFTYSGINNTAPDFKYSIDKYYDTHNHYDIKIQSDMGMSLNDVSYINKWILSTYLQWRAPSK